MVRRVAPRVAALLLFTAATLPCALSCKPAIEGRPSLIDRSLVIAVKSTPAEQAPGNEDGVDFTARDRFFLDGQELVVVNATPLGMKAGDPMPIDVSRLSPSTYVGEVVMKQETTAFLAAARARGCETQIGIDMLFEQIPAYLEFFGLGTTTADELRKLAQIHY